VKVKVKMKMKMKKVQLHPHQVADLVHLKRVVVQLNTKAVEDVLKDTSAKKANAAARLEDFL
jgi:hypothetical protein